MNNKITPQEMEYIIRIIALAREQKFSSDQASLWYALLKEHTYDEIHEATMSCLKTNVYQLRPADILITVRKIRSDRLARMPDLEVPSGVTPAQYNYLLKQAIERATKPPQAPRPPRKQAQALHPSVAHEHQRIGM